VNPITIATVRGAVNPTRRRIHDTEGNQRLGTICWGWFAAAFRLGSGKLPIGALFSGVSWLQWNGKYRDDMRSFVKSDHGMGYAIDDPYLRKQQPLSRRRDECLPPLSKCQRLTISACSRGGGTAIDVSFRFRQAQERTRRVGCLMPQLIFVDG
jgi:hypothetical protein